MAIRVYEDEDNPGKACKPVKVRGRFCEISVCDLCRGELSYLQETGERPRYCATCGARIDWGRE